MKLIVGLGNPGKQYENTRHNIGFMVLDELAKSWNVSFDKTKFNAEYAIAYHNGIKYLLVFGAILLKQGTTRDKRSISAILKSTPAS